jgi:mono/diheme cytochrome c family protein
MRACLLSLILASCASRVDRVLARDGDASAGAIVWGEHCAECHAPDGTGTDLGPDLTDEPESREELAEKILDGWGEMDGFADVLSVRETADVLAFLETTLLPHEG